MTIVPMSDVKSPNRLRFFRAFVFTEKHMIPDYQALMSTPIREIMNSEVVTVSPHEQKMVRLRTRCFPVVSGAKTGGNDFQS